MSLSGKLVTPDFHNIGQADDKVSATPYLTKEFILRYLQV